MFEINLTRLFSVSQFYHFAFMIVSLALLGNGASGTVLTLLPKKKQNIDKNLRTLSFLTLVSILGAYLITNWIPFDSFSIAWDRRQIGYLGLNLLALAMPFFFTGMATGLLLSIYSKEAEKVYAVNLIGAAIGCVLALLTPTFVGGEGTVLLSCILAAFSVLFPMRLTKQPIGQKIIAIISVGIILLGTYDLYARALKSSQVLIPEIKLSPYKSLSYALQYPDAEIISQEWNPYSRVDIVSSTSFRSLPGVSFWYLQLPPSEHGLFIDGDNLNPIVVPGESLEFTNYLPGALAYQLHPGARTLILEPRGGLDVLTAMNEGADTITVVEANNLIISKILHIYQNPDIEVVNETDRSFLRRSRDYFDVIILSLVDTYHPVGSGAYSLAENYSYTVESFRDALNRLSPDGILVVNRWLQVLPSEWLRTFILAATVLEENGDEPGEHIIALRSFNTGVLFIKKSPFTGEELSIVRTFASERAFDLVFLPDIQLDEVNKYANLKEPIYYQTFIDYLSANSAEDWLDHYPYDVSPPTDDHPFFGHYFKWSQTGQIIAELGKTWQPFGGAGYLVVLILLALAFVLTVVLIFLPLLIGSRSTSRLNFQGLPHGVLLASIAYFGLIGFAYLFVEIPFFQSFILYLGQPTYALTTVLFSILLFSGIGSHLSQRIDHRKALLGLVALIFVVLWLFPNIIELSLGFSFAIRVLVTVLVLAPLGILMGIPFPSGIKIVERTAPELIPWVWGINGAASVLSSILSMLLALSFGFKMVLITGALCYAGAWFVVPRLRLVR